jgi:hypothetical protein
MREGKRERGKEGKRERELERQREIRNKKSDFAYDNWLYMTLTKKSK